LEMEMHAGSRGRLSETKGRRVSKRVIAGVAIAVLALTALIIGISLGTRPEAQSTVASFESTNEWYETCLEEALQCDFYFSGSKTSVPAYALSNTADNVDFSRKIKSRTDGRIGGLISNGDGNSFIMSSGEETATEYYSKFAKYQFAPSGAYLMHQAFQGDSAQYADGKCVKVYFSDWQVLNSDGSVKQTVADGDACVVFRTDVAEEKDEETTCAAAASQCEFYFEGHENGVPEYNIDDTADNVAFTDRILSRDSTVNVGIMNSTGHYASFVLGGDLGEQTMHNYIGAFTPYQFRPTGNMPRIMHETFQVSGDANNKCVKVYFTLWQSLDESGNVIGNVESDRTTSCAVFQTASA
jgi:hypothetical protein